MTSFDLVNLGAAEGTSVELPLIMIADWLIDNPAPSWRSQLSRAARQTLQPTFTY